MTTEPSPMVTAADSAAYILTCLRHVDTAGRATELLAKLAVERGVLAEFISSVTARAFNELPDDEIPGVLREITHPVHAVIRQIDTADNDIRRHFNL